MILDLVLPLDNSEDKGRKIKQVCSLIQQKGWHDVSGSSSDDWWTLSVELLILCCRSGWCLNGTMVFIHINLLSLSSSWTSHCLVVKACSYEPQDDTGLFIVLMVVLSLIVPSAGHGSSSVSKWFRQFCCYPWIILTIFVTFSLSLVSKFLWCSIAYSLELKFKGNGFLESSILSYLVSFILVHNAPM